MSKPRHRTVELDGSDLAPTALVVDDDLDVRSAVGNLLEDEGLNVALAANGADALNILRTGLNPDVIVLDIMMPVMDGWDFRAAQLADPALREIPVVVMTASGFVPDTIRRQLNTPSVFKKPLDLDQFLQVVKGACGIADSAKPSSNSA
jgi:CheY-like chemotaxis protein